MTGRDLLLVSCIACGGSVRVDLPEAAMSPPPAPPPHVPVVERIGPAAGSPIALARVDGATYAYIADPDAEAIRIVDLDSQSELPSFELPGRPAQLVMLHDHRIAVALRALDQVVVLAGAGTKLEVSTRIAVPAEPIGLAVSGNDLLVTSGWGHALTVLDGTHAFATSREWELAAEPRAVVVSDDGRTAFVSHAVGGALDAIDLDADNHPIPLAGADEVVGRHSMIHMRDRQPCQGYALAASISPPGRVLAPHVQVFSGDRVASPGYGAAEDTAPAEIFAVGVIDADAKVALRESLKIHDLPASGCTLPRAAVVSADGTLYVACLSSSQVFALDGASIAPGQVQLAEWQVPTGPTGLAIDDERGQLVAWSQYAHVVSVIATRGAPAMTTLALTPVSIDPDIARGRELFAATTTQISKDGRGCESCHPDGRQDTLVWSSPNGPRQAPMLAGRLAATAPYGWNGDARTLDRHLRSTFERLGGAGLSPADRHALVAYLGALPAPHAVGLPSSLVAEGDAIYHSAEAECASCHGDDGRTPDRMRHDVSSRVDGDRRSEFDTPSLAFVGFTAPYYHDGRFGSLRELLASTHGQMGQTRVLAPHELDALEAYLRTL